MKMNLPNRITLFRIILIPFFVLFLVAEDRLPYYSFIATAVFGIACFSDYLDGHIARKYNLVTTFGKFMDPLADKILVITAMILLVEMHMIPAVIVAVIMAREFIISGFRMIASEKGVVIAAGYIGKTKTVFQMLMCIFLLLTSDSYYRQFLFFKLFYYLGIICMWIALVLTIWSLIDYIWKNRKVLYDAD